MARELFEIDIDLQRSGPASLLDALHRQLRDAIDAGRLKGGARLPSTRRLADQLGVSRNTVTGAYELLMSEGYAVGRAGSGTFVTELPRRREAAGTHKVMAHLLAPRWRHVQPPPPWPRQLRHNFRPGVPDGRLFPFDVWRRHVARAWREQERAADATVDPQGCEELRAAIALHVAATRAISCTPEQVVVTTGAQQAFELLARVLVQARRTRVAFENPGCQMQRAPFEAAGAILLNVPVDAQGVQVDLMQAGTNIACVSPSHQFPYGVTMSASRRSELLEFARRRDCLVIEDDYDGEFRLTGRPLDALQTLDHDGRVFYVGTFSKSFFPSIRTGYIIAPLWARAALTAAKVVHNWNVPLSTQLAIAGFAREGHLVRHVRRMRRVYAERYAALHAALARHVPEIVQPWPALGGLHLCGAVASGIDSDLWARAARQAHIRINTVSRYFDGPRPPNGLVFGLGLIDTGCIEDAVRELTSLLPQVARTRPGIQSRSRK